MNIIQALKELSQYHDAHVKLMTPWGTKEELIDVLITESQHIARESVDPNDYRVQPDGIHYDTGEVAYRVEA